MLFRLLFLQMMAQLTSATPKEASLVDTNHAQPVIIQDVDPLGAENQAAVFRESIEMAAEVHSKGISLIVEEMPSPQGNISRSSVNEGQAAICYNPQTVRDCGTTITQSGTILRSPITSTSNLQYPPSTDCKWNVEAPVGMSINVVSLCEFETKSPTQSTSFCYEDYLGFTLSTGEDAKLCGSYSSFSYKMSVNLLTIRFWSNSDSKVGNGFVARIDFVKEGQPDVCYDPQIFRACGTTITQNNTILRSPITSSNNLLYPASTLCEWNVEAPPGSEIHFVLLCQFGTAPLSDTSLCRRDYLRLTLSNGKSSTICGGFKSLVRYTTNANKLNIRFRSDSNHEVNRGFVAKIVIFNGGTGIFRCSAHLVTMSVVAYALLSDV